MELLAHTTPGASALRTGEKAWRLEIPAGDDRQYRLAQVDDYRLLPRRHFPWQAPLRFSLKARVSSPNLPGTWGFGLWNDPFSLSMGFGGGARRLPALPNTAWFFHASPPNHLALRDDLPARGFLAAAFQSPAWLGPLAVLSAPMLPLLALPPFARLARRLASRLIKQEAALVQVDPCEWHTYTLRLDQSSMELAVDGKDVLSTPAIPVGRLGLVLWIDNQYAAYTADGHLGWGLLGNPQPGWLEMEGITCKADSG